MTVSESQIPAETLDFIFGHVRDAAEQQLRDAEALDSKVFQLFSVASVVIGLAGVSSNLGGGWSPRFLGAALAAYALSGIATLVCIWVRRFRRALHADSLWLEHWNESPSDIKHAIVHDLSQAYPHNKRLLNKKAWAVRVVTVGLAAEVLLVGLSLSWNRLV